jgi:DNA polymerase III delta prime subunit
VASYRFLGREAWADRIVRQVTQDGGGQPFLFTGPEGTGKEATALEIARRLDCVAPESCHPAELCESCVKAISFQHPDIRWIGPAPASLDENGLRELCEQKRANPFYQAPFAASARIAIGDPEHPGPASVRALIRFLRLQAFQGRFKAAVVADAHRLSAGAANALLKTLEEPPPRTLIFLTSSNPSALLATIRSRCQKVRFEPYGEAELAAVLRALGADEELTATLARQADGNARKAVALLRPEARALAAWAGELVAAIHAGRRGAAHVAADQIHGGVLPDRLLGAVDPAADPRAFVAKDLGVKRERALQLCEMLNLYYSETLACRERGPDWRSRLPAAAESLRELARRRETDSLLADIERLERAKAEIDRNLNIGLCMAVLFEDLIDHAERERQAAEGRR